jgi:hypothetical protein
VQHVTGRNPGCPEQERTARKSIRLHAIAPFFWIEASTINLRETAAGRCKFAKPPGKHA